jgi:hypothetical protein
LAVALAPPAVRAPQMADRRAHRSRCALDGLALGQDWYGRVVSVQPLGGEHMALD